MEMEDNLNESKKTENVLWWASCAPNYQESAGLEVRCQRQVWIEMWRPKFFEYL